MRSKSLENIFIAIYGYYWGALTSVSSYTSHSTVPSNHRGYRLFNHPSISRTFITRPTHLSSQNENSPEKEVKLILGEDLSKNIASVGSEQGFLAAAKRRAEEHAKKREEEEKKKAMFLEQEKEEATTVSLNNKNHNYGPGDLSSWNGFVNDGFEASAGNDGEDGWEVKGGILLFKDEKQNNNRDASGTSTIVTKDTELFLFDEKNDGKLIL